MNGFFERFKWRMAGWMQGRYGSDAFSQALIVCGIVLLLLELFTGSGLCSALSFVALAYALFRCYSRNSAARQRENDAYLRMADKPKKDLALAKLNWRDRKTTRYFPCPGCGTTLSVPRGKGTLRVVCPRCRTESTRKS